MLPSLQSICLNLKIDQADVVNVYTYGSRVYGTASAQSDFDFIAVLKDSIDPHLSLDPSTNLNITVYHQDEFAQSLRDHKVPAMECHFLPPHLLLVGNTTFNFKLDKKLLRESFSGKASNSWVKAKKKFEVVQDRNIYIAKKSLFHCLRIIDFGIQIAESGRITNYASTNAIWRDIHHDQADQWDPYKTRYQNYYNEQMTRFRKLAPK